MTYTQELEKALETLRIAFVETRQNSQFAHQLLAAQNQADIADIASRVARQALEPTPEQYSARVRRQLQEEEARELYEYKRHLQDIQDELARIERATPFPVRLWRRFWSYILTTRIMFAFGRYLLTIGEER